MTSIFQVTAWQALDSRGRPTVACRVELDDGSYGTAIVPSGASAGSHEACELRDGGSRFGGRGVQTAVKNVNTVLANAVIGVDASGEGAVDRVLARTDMSRGFSTLGANATLAVSLAASTAAAKSAGTSLARHLSGPGPLLLPMPMINIISGGAHARGGLDVQDFLLVPHGAASFSEAIEWSLAVREAATVRALKAGYGSASLVADEGGLGIPLETNASALDLLTRSIEDAGLRPGVDAGIAIDVAATELYVDGHYEFRREQRSLTSTQLIEEIVSWCGDYPVVSVEDPLAEDDWMGWEQITAVLSKQVELVGDDLFVTSLERLESGIEAKVANSILIKVNQNGLLSGAQSVLKHAQSSGYKTIVSARSGDTEDTWLADLAVGWRAEQIKVGSTHRSERTAKWNRLLELEATESTAFAGPWQAGHNTVRARPERTTHA